MLTLTLLRHAKSSWADERMDDHERPLNARGLRDTQALAESLGETLGTTPNAAAADEASPVRVLCSTATRTRQTLAALQQADVVGTDAVTLDDALYLAPPTNIEALVDAADDADHLLVIGHNPGMESLASSLAGRDLTMKTSSYCHFERENRDECWRFITQQTPRA